MSTFVCIQSLCLPLIRASVTVSRKSLRSHNSQNLPSKKAREKRSLNSQREREREREREEREDSFVAVQRSKSDSFAETRESKESKDLLLLLLPLEAN
ncbi:hypothetical protein Bca4012_071816 [Brassica carinata]|uniref:(rape) hypothetical protein n=1 Tax=Brassica napus TaxID=3708 RepID=A0A816KXD3_BRANA|nr:unnamed protein product [Brassica napus]